MRLRFIMPVLSLLILAGCSPTFLVSKDCKTYFFGEEGEGMHDLLCRSGDLRAVLGDSGLSPELKEGLYAAQCVDRSKEKVRALYASLSPAQKKDLQSSFIRHGYDINYKPTGNYRFDYGYEGPEFCPPPYRRY